MSVTPSPTDRAPLITRLHRIEGQVRALERMIDHDAPCIDILTQVSAASHALQSLALILLDQHLRRCVAEAAAGGDLDADAKLRQASQVIARLVGS